MPSTVLPRGKEVHSVQRTHKLAATLPSIATEQRIKSIKTKRTHEARYKTRHFNEMSFSNCFCQLRPPESRI